jgi:hypothetical protein
MLAARASTADTADVNLIARAALEYAAKAQILEESASQAADRHARVARRRADVQVLCHKGAVEFAHENTLEAYRATFDLGGDGNEIDIRATRDGVLICFHDDMLDRLLHTYGEASDYSWAELRALEFRNPGPFGKHCRIPTLVDALQLHREHAGLLQIDMKGEDLDNAVASLLDRMDMWDHVVVGLGQFPQSKNGRYLASLYFDGSQVEPTAIHRALAKTGDCLFVEDPRGVAVVLGRPIQRPSDQPVARLSLPQSPDPDLFPTKESLLADLQDADDWNKVAQTPERQSAAADRIRRRAGAAELLGSMQVDSEDAVAALTDRVRHSGIHLNWIYHDLDGAMALRTLLQLRVPGSIELARRALWRGENRWSAAVDVTAYHPQASKDFRTKMIIFPALEDLPGSATEQLCRDYLALSDRQARALGTYKFQEASRTLLAVSPTWKTALELMRHRRGEVRGRAILGCVDKANEDWARKALAIAAPHALAYVLPRSGN